MDNDGCISTDYIDCFLICGHHVQVEFTLFIFGQFNIWSMHSSGHVLVCVCPGSFSFKVFRTRSEHPQIADFLSQYFFKRDQNDLEGMCSTL